MTRKLSQLSQEEQASFLKLKQLAKHQSPEAKMALINRFDLDLSEPEILDFLMPTLAGGQVSLDYPQANPNPIMEQAWRPQGDFYPDYQNMYPVGEEMPQEPTQAPVVNLNQDNTSPARETPKRAMTYANSRDWIIIQNRLLHAISHLTLNERRLILMLSPLVRKQTSQNPNQCTFVVRAEDFANEYGLKRDGIYKTLEKTADTLLEKAFWFWNFKEDDPEQKTHKTGLSWVSKCDYMKSRAEIHVELHRDVIEMLTIFDKNTGNYWTQYHKDWISNLGSYGIVMLEILLSSLEQRGYYSIKYLRQKFDCVDSYARFSHFKHWVIDRGIKEIETTTPIRVNYDIQKRGREVEGVSFSYIDTSQRTLKTTPANPAASVGRGLEQGNQGSGGEFNPFVNFKMTSRQLALFAGKINKITGQPLDEITSELSNVHLQGKHLEHLKLLDYVPSNWYGPDEIAKHPTVQQLQDEVLAQKNTELAQKAEQDKIFRLAYAVIQQQAQRFVSANQNRVNRSTIEYFYLSKGDYLSVVKSWERLLLDPLERRGFALIDEMTWVAQNQDGFD